MKNAPFYIKTGRIFKSSLSSFWRNRLLSIATVLVMTITLITIAIFVILNLAIDTSVKSIGEKIDLIVYFNETTTEKQIKVAIEKAKELPDVSNVEYIDKKKALLKWRDIQKNQKVTNVFSEQDNPFPRSIEIKSGNPESIDETAQFFQTGTMSKIVKKTSYRDSKNTIEKLIKLTKTIKNAGYIATGFFVLVSILVVFNTMRLAIHNREEEINIMKLVGGTKASISLPFVIEGILYALLATIFSTLIILVASKYLVNTNFLDYNLSATYYAFFVNQWLKIVIWQLGVGIIIGTICSLFAVNKYIKI
jgi:cell division transport system permease protein